MLRVKTFVAESSGKGLGLFAAQSISVGETTWQYDENFDRTFGMEEVNKLPQFLQNSFFKYGYFDYSLDRLIVPIDDLRFINHSELNYNISSMPEKDIARQEISIGEELLCNYRHFEYDYFERRKLDPSIWK